MDSSNEESLFSKLPQGPLSKRSLGVIAIQRVFGVLYCVVTSSSESSAVLVIDAGNTRVKFAWMEIPAGGGVPQSRGFSAIPVGADLPVDLIREWLQGGTISRAVIAGSNPPEVERVRAAWSLDVPLEGLPPREKLPLVIDVDFPQKVGIDRLLNAIAANVRRQPGQPAIVIDSGTATTIDLIDETGTFRGGAILPGFEMSSKALHQYTALLPLVPHHRLHEREPETVGRNTEAAVESGLYWGHVGAVRELVDRLLQVCAGGVEPLVLLTGGTGPLLKKHLPFVEWDAAVCLQGLALAAAEARS